MPPSPVQLKEKLLETIDEENNITNYNSFLEVIVLLEKTPLTREDLSITRLGRYVNAVRKAAPEPLAKRLRKLVKSWLTLCNSTPSNNASPASGYSPVSGFVNSPRPASVPHSSSPHLQNKSSSSPALQQSNRSWLASPAPTDSPAQRLVSPLVRQVGGLDSSAQINNRRISPSNYKSSAARSNAPLPFSKTSSSRPDTPNGTKHSRDSWGARTPTPPQLNNHVNTTANSDSTLRTHAANKKRRRSDESCNSDSSSIKKTRGIVNGDSTRAAVERIRTPKVKTTVEILAELQAGNSAPLTASDTITKIVTNQIEKEEDDIHQSVVPISAMPKSRRKPAASTLLGPPSARSDLSKAKSELMRQFLHQQQPHSEENDELRFGASYGSSNSPLTTAGQGGAKAFSSAIDLSINPYSLLPPLDYDTITWSDEEPDDGVVCRNPITGEYPDGYEPGSSDSSDHTTTPHIERVINDDWHGVNGTANENSQFHPWTETFTITEENDQVDSAHVLLPYVDI